MYMHNICMHLHITCIKPVRAKPARHNMHHMRLSTEPCPQCFTACYSVGGIKEVDLLIGSTSGPSGIHD